MFELRSAVMVAVLIGGSAFTTACNILGSDEDVFVSGTVVSLETGEPIPDVTVRLYTTTLGLMGVPGPPDVHTVRTTDNEGHFSVSASFAECPSRGVNLHAEHPDYPVAQQSEVECPGTSTLDLQMQSATASQRLEPSSATVPVGGRLTLHAVFRSLEGVETETPTYQYPCAPTFLTPFTYCASHQISFGFMYTDDGWGYDWALNGYPCGYFEGPNISSRTVEYVAPLRVPSSQCGGSVGEVVVSLAPHDSVENNPAILTVVP